LSLKFSGENPSAQVYEIIHNAIAPAIPDPLNRAVVLFFAIQSPPAVDIKLQLPEGARAVLKKAPLPPQMNVMLRKLTQRLSNADST